jgi:allophanate hydrolase
MNSSRRNVPLDIGALQALYRSGQETVAGVIAILLQRINENPDDNVWINRVDDASVVEQAEKLDRALREGPDTLEHLPLFGIPFAVKDNIDVKGIPTTAACPEFSYLPAENAPAITRLLEAGAILIGKTNMDQFATGLVGTRSPYGTPVNPFDPDYIPGGSSSGSAVAVAKGYVTFSLGTDTAGSGRVPAAYNNIVGLKPTRGRISTTGVVPACRSLDCLSIFSLCCGDAELVTRVTEGFDATDTFSRHLVSLPSSDSRQLPESFRLGVPRADQLLFFDDARCQKAFRALRERATEIGFSLIDVDFAPFRETGRLLYHGPWVTERQLAFGTELAHYENSADPSVRDAVLNTPSYTAADQFSAYYRLKQYRREAEKMFADVHALLVPTFGRAYTLDEAGTPETQANWNLGYYTNFVNLMDLAAVSVPTGALSNSLPFGVTLIGPAQSESLLLDFGDQLHRATCKQIGADLQALPDTQPAGSPSTNNRTRLCVVGAHMRGLPLSHQLTSLGGRFVQAAATAPCYRLYLLDHLAPVRPGLVRTPKGSSIEAELWELPTSRLGEFINMVAAPLTLGTVELNDGNHSLGFLCESYATETATDISSFGGWRAYVQ